MVVLDVCHPVFNSSRGCDHHSQDRIGLTAHGRPSLDPRLSPLHSSVLACAHFHSVYITVNQQESGIKQMPGLGRACF